jgi:hypothetical protein
LNIFSFCFILSQSRELEVHISIIYKNITCLTKK